MSKRRRQVDPRQLALYQAKLARYREKHALLQMRDAGQRLRYRAEPAPLVVARAPVEAQVLAQSEHAVTFERSGLPPEVYFTLAEARAAIRERERSSGTGVGLGLAIGLGAIAILGLGVVVCYLLFRRKDVPPATTPASENLAAPRVVEREVIREVPTIIREVVASPATAVVSERPKKSKKKAATAPLPEAATRFGQGTLVQTVVLPAMLNSRTPAVRLATATDRPCRATIRVVAPIGSFAALAFSPNELNAGVAAIPTGDTLVMPAGDHQEFRLKPRQAIFAKGSIDGVVVSVLYTETPGDLT